MMVATATVMHMLRILTTIIIMKIMMTMMTITTIMTATMKTKTEYHFLIPHSFPFFLYTAIDLLSASG